jgi:hypothetical protein
LLSFSATVETSPGSTLIPKDSLTGWVDGDIGGVIARA